MLSARNQTEKKSYIVGMFPTVTVTNYHRLWGLKQHIVTILHFYKSEAVRSFTRGWNQGGWSAAFLLQLPGDHLFPGLFQLLEVPVFLGLWSLPPSSKPAVWHLPISLSDSIISLPSLTDPLPPSWIDAYVGPTGIIQDNLPTSSSLIDSHAQSPFYLI